MDLTPALLATNAAPALPKTANAAAAQKAAQNFAAFFLSQSFETMFQGVGDDDLFGGGEGEKIYRSMLLQEFGKVAAKSGGIGIAAAVQREIMHQQEAK
ncbi:MAG: rod-binding protein [Stellaceae bacterium]